MSKGLFSVSVHAWIRFLAFALIVIGMPSTKVLLSFGLVFAIANWFLEGNFLYKWQQIKSNKLLQLLIIFYLLLVIGLTWSWDIYQGLKDIKSRLPMLALPLIFATSPPLETKRLHQLLFLFLTSLVITSVFNVLNFNFLLDKSITHDIRALSFFSSHIRYGLLIAMGFGICIWWQISNNKFHLLFTILALWFVFYSFYSQIFSGIIALSLTVSIILFYYLHQYKKILAYFFIALVLISFSLIISLIFNRSHEKIDCSKLPTYTANGNFYSHDCQDFSEINGKAILAYYSEYELKLFWNNYSEMDFMGLDKKGHYLRTTIARYMTALNLPKDAEGLKKLTKEDIQNIENGYTYPREKYDIFMPRIYGLKFQLLNNHNPNGHSLLQRFEYWKASFHLIKKHWLLGVGTGGNEKVFQQVYEELNSPLEEKNRKRSHNMFLTYTVSYGIFGLLLFCLILFFAFTVSWKNKDLLSLIFLVIICGSFLNEDTLETQLGVTFFGFFMGILIGSINKEVK